MTMGRSLMCSCIQAVLARSDHEDSAWLRVDAPRLRRDGGDVTVAIWPLQQQCDRFARLSRPVADDTASARTASYSVLRISSSTAIAVHGAIQLLAVDDLPMVSG